MTTQKSRASCGWAGSGLAPESIHVLKNFFFFPGWILFSRGLKQMEESSITGMMSSLWIELAIPVAGVFAALRNPQFFQEIPGAGQGMLGLAAARQA